MKSLSVKLGIITLFILVGCSYSQAEIQINPTVKFQGDWLIIKNNNNFTYDYVKVTLNGKFKKELPFSIPDGEEAKYRLSSFVKSDGERFNIITHSLIDVAISCECARQSGGRWEKLGRGFYYGKFR